MKDNNKCCMGSYAKSHGGILLAVGLLVLANTFWPFTSWGMLLGLILAILGLAKMIMPCCSHYK